MKKIIIICFLIFGSCLLFGQVKTNAKLPPGMFLPLGANYFDPENIIYRPIDGGMSGTLNSREKIVIKANTMYYIQCLDVDNIRFDSGTIICYDDQSGQVELDLLVEEECIFFQTSPNGKKISLVIAVTNYTDNDQVQLWDIGANYIMFEDGTVDDEELNNTPFIGYKPTGGNEVTSSSIQITTNASNPISYDTIINNLKAYDFSDGEIETEVLENTYGTENYEAGDWMIKVKAENSRDMVSELTINIHVTDDIAPVISGPSEFVMQNTNMKTITTVVYTLTASDNKDGDLTDRIEIDSKNDAFTNRTEQLGTFPVTFYVCDSSGNVGTHTVDIIVEQGDFHSPVFSGTFIRAIPVESPMTEEEILAGVTAIDDFSGDVTDRIIVTYNDYKYNTNRVGNYKISMEVTDDAGNTSHQDIMITTYEKTNPSFVFDAVVVYLPLKMEMESTADIIELLQKTGYITDDDVEIVLDGYSENKYALGSYRITLEQNNSETNVLVRVEEGVEYLNSIKLPKSVEYNIDLTNRPAVLNMIYNVCCRVKAFFKDFFDAIF